MIIRDPIHGNVKINDVERDIIECSVFQRLLHIKQLSMVYLVYPGAMHTRFEHSVGTMHLADKAGKELGISGKDLAELRVAALVHDIGHPAFSHLVEMFLKEDHEKKSIEIIKNSELYNVLEKGGIDPKNIIKIIERDKLVSHQILDSDVDVDRIDYLLRDAHHCGVAYGRAVDADRLLCTLRKYKENVVLDEKGLSAAETLLFTRYIMRETVYGHRISRVGDAMLCYCLNKALENNVLKKDDLFKMTDSEVIYKLQNSGIKEIKMQVERLLKRRLLKEVSAVQYGDLNSQEKKIIAKLGANWDAKEEFERKLAGIAGANDGEILVDIPKIPVMKESKIKVLTKKGLKKITAVSLMAKVINEAYNSTWRIRVFADKKHLRKLKNPFKIILK